MTEVLAAYLDGVRCGEFTQTPHGDLRFRYDDAYRARPDPTPLSLSMPTVLPEHRRRVVLPFLQGLLPDNENALMALGRLHDVNPRNPFALLGKMGRDVAGALQILPLDQASSDGPGPVAFTPLEEVEIEDALRSVVEEYRRGRTVPPPLGRFSLAGAQPKIALFQDDTGRWGTPHGSTPTTHILKPVTGDLAHFDIVEWMTMRAAAHLGLHVASSEIAAFGSIRSFVTRRYDRGLVEGCWHRRHQEDLAQSLGVSPERKYQHRDGGPGVGAVARLIRGLASAQDRASVTEDLFSGLMFNTVLQNTDAHVKNYSVMLRGGRVSLAPLYDLATIAPYALAPTYSAMKIGDEYAYSRIGPAQCLAAARTLGLDAVHAADQLERIRNGALAAFAQARAELEASLAGDASSLTFADTVVDAVSRLPLVA